MKNDIQQTSSSLIDLEKYPTKRGNPVISGIYAIVNRRNGKMYIGLSSDVERRFAEHKAKRNSSNMVISKAIRKYGVNSFDLIVLEPWLDVEDMPEREIYWIKKLNPIYNISEGGSGNTSRRDEKTKCKISKALKERWENLSEKEKSKISNNLFKNRCDGHSQSEETREKLRQANLGKKQSKETKEKRAKKLRMIQIGNTNGNKPVYKLDLENNIIDEYISIKIASESIGIHPSNITKVLKGEQTTAGGHKWRYKNTKDE